MSEAAADFRRSPHCEPHHVRTRAILRDHPEIRELIGHNPWSIVVIAGAVALQFTIAWLLRDAAWWLILVLAYGLGAFANHAMYVMIHDATHGLIFKRRTPNNLAAILAGLVNVVPTSMSFREYHLKHHAFQGVHELDADLPGYWEARIVGKSFVRKAIWLLLYPFVQAFRPARLKQIRFITAWTLIDWALTFSVAFAVVWFWGPRSLGYLFASLFFAVGLHPLGARWIQEHYLTGDDDQETFSYYGPLNLVAFNVGYHNEHHDFVSVPWNRLPDIRAAAPEYYEGLERHESWARLMWRFLTEADLSLYSRMLRDGRHGSSDSCA